MSGFSRYQKSTSANILYTGVNAAIGPDALTLPANKGKFLENDNTGNMVWTSLPLPDVNAQTSDKNNYVVVFDFPTKSFKLKRFTIPYYPDQDSLIKYLYLPSSSTTTFTSGALTYMKNMAQTGTTYDIGVDSTTKILYGSKITLGPASSGLNFSRSRGAGWWQMQNGTPRTANHAFVFAFTPDITGFTGPLMFLRTQPSYAGSADNKIFASYSPSTTPANSAVVWNGNTNQINFYPYNPAQMSCCIFSFVCLNNVMYIYGNGTLLAQQNDFEIFNSTEVLSFLNGSDVPEINNNYNFYGNMYATAMMENITSIIDVQRFEGYVKWTSPMATLPWVLDGTHPYAHTAPSL